MTRQEEIKTLLQKRRRRLQALKEKEAIYGYSADPSILLEIEDIETEIKNLQAELEQLESNAAASPTQPQYVPPPAPQASSASPEALALQEALQRRSLALFIGADLPQTVTGLPSRRDLARQLARRKGLDETLSLSEVAQRVSQAGHRWEFTNFLRTALDTTGKAPQPFHQRLAALVKAHQIETIITTAYDNLLELAFQQAGLGFNRVVRGSDVNFIDPDRPTLIKLYGDLQQPDTMVVTDQDHSALLRDREREAIIDELRGGFRRTTLLFLGYDLADPDFRFLFDQIAESRFARQAYAVWPGLPKDDVRMWRDRGIVILEADPLAVLTETVELSGAPVRPEAAMPEPRPQAAPSSRRERAWVAFKLQIARLVNLEFEVRAFQTPMGEPHAAGHLPYSPADLIPVLKALDLGAYDPTRFTPSQTEALQKLGLLGNPRLVANLLPRIGGGLYQALFPETVGTAFQLAFTQARSRRDTVALQLRFDEAAVDLARYPWELIHDGRRHLLSGGLVEMTRYIAYPEATTPLAAAPPWRLLYVAARPKNLDSLPPDAERAAVWAGLQALTETEKFTPNRLDTPTYDALLDQMAAHDYHILHFDGHGLFARRCPECETLYYPHLTTCATCDAPLNPPQGYLAFEDNAGQADYVSTEEMENLLVASQVRLVVLSACQSAVVRGETMFGGLGPGLIRAGVPAVAAMQFSIPVGAAVRFAAAFYGALAKGETVPRAVAQGRRKLFRNKTWFMPILYLRSADDEGRLFVE